MEWMTLPLKRYADFSGRSRRKEYWMYALLQLLIYGVLGLLLAIVGGLSSDGSGLGAGGTIVIILLVIVALALFVPTLAVTIRRFHDQDKSGWFVLMQFIPYVGGLIVLVFMCLEGTRGPNRFGPDPKAPGHSDVFS